MHDRSIQTTGTVGKNYAAKYGHLDLFHDVDLRSISDLLDVAVEIAVPAGQTVLEEGAFNDVIYIVLDGQLDVRLGAINATPLLTLEVGACVGELSILSQLNVSAYVVAVRASQLLVIRDDLLWSIISASHEFARNLLRILSGRVRENNNRLKISFNAQEKFARASRVDSMTGLFNRHWLDEVLERQTTRCAAEGSTFSLILMDIDHFKQINDRYGHLVGDDALKTIASHLHNCTRPIDLAARFGGDEFAVMLPGVGIAEAKFISERMREEIERDDILCSFGGLRLTVSLGIAELENHDSPADLLDKADRALYEAKHRGRNCAVSASELQPIVLV